MQICHVIHASYIIKFDHTVFKFNDYRIISSLVLRATQTEKVMTTPVIINTKELYIKQSFSKITKIKMPERDASTS